MEEFPVPNTTLLVDHYGGVYDSSTKSIINSELIRIGQQVIRVRALVVNTYLSYGRIDLLKNVDKPVYLLTSPTGAKSYSVNLSEFCRDEGLDYKRMHKACETGYQTRDDWRVEVIN